MWNLIEVFIFLCMHTYFCLDEPHKFHPFKLYERQIMKTRKEMYTFMEVNEAMTRTEWGTKSYFFLLRQRFSQWRENIWYLRSRVLDFSISSDIQRSFGISKWQKIIRSDRLTIQNQYILWGVKITTNEVETALLREKTKKTRLKK